jgi:hypothetical protein
VAESTTRRLALTWSATSGAGHIMSSSEPGVVRPAFPSAPAWVAAVRAELRAQRPPPAAAAGGVGPGQDAWAVGLLDAVIAQDGLPLALDAGVAGRLLESLGRCPSFVAEVPIGGAGALPPELVAARRAQGLPVTITEALVAEPEAAAGGAGAWEVER